MYGYYRPIGQCTMATPMEGNKMAPGSSASLRRIQEDYLNCPICLEEFKEPKVLPCLHRFCAECLKRVINKNRRFKCPLCKKELMSPLNGVDGYMTDFAMQNIMEALRKSAEALATEEEQSEKAVDSAKTSCRICRIHKDEPLNYCCATCGNTPVCRGCCTDSGRHEYHVTHEAAELARAESDNLIESLAMLSHYKKNIRKIQGLSSGSGKDIDSGGPESLYSKVQNVWELAKAMLESEDDWTKIHLIPGVCKAIGDLTKQLRRLSASPSPDMSPTRELLGANVYVAQQSEHVIDVIKSANNNWEVNGMTSCDDGVLVMTGKATSVTSHVTVFNMMEGKVTRQDEFQRKKPFRFIPKRYCATLSAFQVATVCIPDEVGVYDIRDGSLIRRNISDLSEKWDSSKYVMCVTTDATHADIIVGSNSNKCLFVFDSLLNFKRIIMLPELLKWPRDLSAHCQDKLLICDYSGKRAYAVKITAGTNAEVLYEFTKPDVPGCGDWTPFRICVDHSKFVYVMWENLVKANGFGTFVGQYNKSDGSLISQIQSNTDARNLNATMTEYGEKFVLATKTGDKLFIHDMSYDRYTYL